MSDTPVTGTMTGTLSAVITRADGTVEDLGVISVIEVPVPESDDSDEDDD